MPYRPDSNKPVTIFVHLVKQPFLQIPQFVLANGHVVVGDTHDECHTTRVRPNLPCQPSSVPKSLSGRRTFAPEHPVCYISWVGTCAMI